MTGEIPTELGDLANLRRLELNNNQLTGAIPAEVGKLARLETLTFHSNKLEGSVPAELGALTELQSLWLALNPGTRGGLCPIPSWRSVSCAVLRAGEHRSLCTWRR